MVRPRAHGAADVHPYDSPYVLKDGRGTEQTIAGDVAIGGNLTVNGQNIYGGSEASDGVVLNASSHGTPTGAVQFVGGNSGAYVVVDAATNTTRGLFIRHQTTGDMVDDFGALLAMAIRDNAGVNNTIGTLSCLRTSADNTGYFALQTANAGTLGTRLTVGPTGISEFFADAAGFGAIFFNDGNNTNRQGIAVKCGEDAPAGTNIFFEAQEGDGTATGRLQTTGAGTFALADVSDVRRKTNIAPTKIDPEAIIKGLELIEFSRRKTYQHDTGLVDERGRRITEEREHTYDKVSCGFSAQNCQGVFPEMVSEGPGGLMTAKAELVPVLVLMVQRLIARVEQLEAVRG